MQIEHSGLRQFRARVQELYRQVVIDDSRLTQAQLAQAIGISAKELSLRLGGAVAHRLSHDNIHAIVRVLAQWQAISTVAEAEELLELVNCPTFAAAEWATPPLAKLKRTLVAEGASYSCSSSSAATMLGSSASTFDGARLRERLRELYRAADPYGTGRPPTQADLAGAIGLDRAELNKRLSGSGGKHLSARDGRAIVRTLAAWRAITTRAEAEGLLALMGIANFTAAEWLSPPLDQLEAITVAPTSSNLPRELTSFVGRERELVHCLHLLSRSPLLTITGMGGIGKTRLALELARRSLPDFPDGVYQVPLAQLSDPMMLTSVIGSSLGLTEARSRSDLELIFKHLQGKKVLLVFDNCEHLVSAIAALVHSLLTRCPLLTIIATSRERLAVVGESICTIQPLSLPSSQLSDPAALPQSEAVSLLVARAQASNPGFALTEANAAAVAAVCRLLEGIPLAIELTAPLLRTLSASQIASRLGDRLSGLGGVGTINSPDRQRTMQTSIAWSYDLLTDHERTLFRRLAAFRGGWSLSAAEAVCADNTLKSDAVLPNLAKLVDKSLVITGEVAGEMRYQMLETVREYALSRLEANADGDANEEQAVRSRHLNYFLALAEEAALYSDSSGGQWFSRLDADLDNLRAALDHALAQPDSTFALRLVVALNVFWRVRGWVNEGRTWVAAALARQGAEHTVLRGEALLTAATLAFAQGDYAASEVAANQALLIGRRQRNIELAANSFNALGLLAMSRSDYPQAKFFYSKSFGLWQSLDNKPGLAVAIHNLAHITDEQGDYQTAHQLFLRSLSLSEALGHLRLTATTLVGLGDIAMKLHDYTAAEAYLQESLALSHEIGNKRGIAIAMAMLGQNAQQMGDYGTAQHLLEDSLQQIRELGHLMEMAQILTVLAKVAYGRGNFSRAHTLHREGLQLATKLGFKQEIANSLEGLARLACLSGLPAKAVTLSASASKLRAATNTTSVAEGISEDDMAELAARLGPAIYAAALAKGQTFTLEQAIDYALAYESEDDVTPVASLRRPLASSAAAKQLVSTH